MPESTRNQVLDALVTKIQGLTGARPWGGSYPRPLTVTRRPTTIHEWPYVVVLQGTGSSLAVLSTNGAFEHQFKVLIQADVQGDETVGWSVWLERLWDDIVRACLADQGLGGVCRELAFDGRFEVEEIEGEFGNVGRFTQGLTVIADEAFSVG